MHSSTRSSHGMTDVTFYGVTILTDRKTGRPVLQIRMYNNPKTGMRRCCVRYFHDDEYFIGIGRAGGYGYDKSGAALFDAFRDMGVNLSPNCASGFDTILQAALYELNLSDTTRRIDVYE